MREIKLGIHSVQFICSLLFVSLRLHRQQGVRLPSPSPTSGTYSDSCPSHRGGHPTISCSFIPFSSHLQSIPASRSFPMSQLFASGGQSIGVSASASVHSMNIQDWFPLGLMVDLLAVQGLQHHNSKASILLCSTLFIVQLSHPYMTTGKP